MLGLGLSIPRCAVRAGDALTREVASILAKYGTDAHVYLPGIGVINGLTAGNYLDSAGTTASTVDNPVGLVLDAGGSVGSELVTNGDFSNSSTGWVLNTGWTVSSGALQATSVTNFQAIQILSISANKTYKVTLTISNYVSGAFKFSLGMSYDTTYADISGNGTYTFYRVAKATDTNLYIYPTGGFTGSIDNISVKEVTGIHATQATTANKPILRRGAVNLLTYSEQFDNAAWTKSNSSLSGNVLTSTIPNESALFQTSATAFAIGTQLTVTVRASVNTSGVYLYIRNINISDVGSNMVATFNLETGTVLYQGSAYSSASITAVGNGEYDCTVTGTKLGSTVVNRLDIGMTTSSIGNLSCTVGNKINIFRAQLETGSTASTYIPTTTAAASSPTGNYHWVHDSTDVLTATFPAGYESATTINASTAGQSTLTAQNIVGAYNIGPSIDTYGRFVFKTITASELAIIQSYCNRLAGV